MQILLFNTFEMSIFLSLDISFVFIKIILKYIIKSHIELKSHNLCVIYTRFID